MEEVDSIILHFLRQLNVNIDESVKNLCDLSVEIIIEAASACLRAIDPGLKVPTKLPSGISHRIEVAAQIATCCKDLGYKNDVGYQTFLYYNECDLRQVFMFLIETLPNEGQKSTNITVLKKKSLLMQDIGNKIDQELKRIWIPPCCKPVSQKIGDFEDLEYGKHISYNVITLTEEELIAKLLKLKQSKEVTTKADDAHDLQKNNDKNVVQYGIDKTLKELKEMAIVLRQKLDTLESEKNVMEVEYSQAQRLCERAEADLKNVENILNGIGISDIKSEAGADGSLLEKVQRAIDMLHKKSEELTSRNLSLKAEINELNNSVNSSESQRSQCKKALTTLKETAKAMRDEYEKKEISRNQLKENYEKLRKGNKRSIYTKRILEIISNVDKQNMEIKKILEDTRQIQKEINSLEGQLDRCFSIADETLFRDAKKDDQAKKAYKLLALLHSECNTIVSLVNDMGTMSREIVDLEENIKTETAKRTEDTLRKIQHDLARMQEET